MHIKSGGINTFPLKRARLVNYINPFSLQNLMSEENKEVPVSFYVLVGFSVLFLVFFLVGQRSPQRNSEVTGALTVAGQDLSSPLWLIILGTVSILLLGFIVVAIIKIKHKKSAAVVPVVPKADKEIQLPGSKIETKPSDSKLTESEIESLFKDQDPDLGRQLPNSLEKPQPTSFGRVSQIPISSSEPEKVMANLVQLKYVILGMLKEHKSGQEVNDFLLEQGYTAQQIEKATDEINVENLRDYIRRCLSQGISKSQIFENLKIKNWRIDLVNKAFLSIN